MNSPINVCVCVWRMSFFSRKWSLPFSDQTVFFKFQWKRTFDVFDQLIGNMSELIYIILVKKKKYKFYMNTKW